MPIHDSLQQLVPFEIQRVRLKGHKPGPTFRMQVVDDAIPESSNLDARPGTLERSPGGDVEDAATACQAQSVLPGEPVEPPGNSESLYQRQDADFPAGRYPGCPLRQMPHR